MVYSYLSALRDGLADLGRDVLQLEAPLHRQVQRHVGRVRHARGEHGLDALPLDVDEAGGDAGGDADETALQDAVHHAHAHVPGEVRVPKSNKMNYDVGNFKIWNCV